MQYLFIILLAIVIGVVVWWFISRRGKSPKNKRPRIYGQTCPRCHSEDIHYAGYADRKECGKCGKIF